MNENTVPGQLTRHELDTMSSHELNELDDQARYLQGVCAGPDGYRWTAGATVTAAAELAAAGVPVPVSGDAGTRWLRC